MPQSDINNLPKRRRKGYDALVLTPAFKETYPIQSTRMDFEKQGFPANMRTSFNATAEMINSVVSTRVPGPATTTLIGERNDLKGYFIKAKSCNWGPMAGFLCRHPAFSKKGAAGVTGNGDSHLGYKDYLVKKFGMKDDNTVFVNRAFVPIKISDARKKEVFDNPGSKFAPYLQEPIGNDKIYGLAVDKQPVTETTVVMEYLLVKEATLWKLYHGNVYVKGAAGNGGFLPPDSPLMSSNFEQGTTLGINTAAINKLKEKLKDFKITRNDVNQWRTVDGLMNPYPPYQPDTNPNYYKNAVTGDYDLFAVWPKVPVAGFRELIRVSEDPAQDQIARAIEYETWGKKPVTKRHYLQGVPGKSLALELTKTRDVFMEFIPDGPTLGKLEYQYKGNVNEIVERTVGTLNSLVISKYPKTNGNVAFHSDEGGRPGVDEIEYPVAFFLPRDLAVKYAVNPNLMIENHVQFLALILFLQGEFFIPIQWGWWRHWFAIIEPPSLGKYSITSQIDFYKKKATAEQDQKKKGKLEEKLVYWENRKKEYNDTNTRTQIEDMLKLLFVPDTTTSQAAGNATGGSPAVNLNKEADKQAFEKIKSVFWEWMAADQITPLGTGPFNYEYWKSRFENLWVKPT